MVRRRVGFEATGATIADSAHTVSGCQQGCLSAVTVNAGAAGFFGWVLGVLDGR